MFSDRLDNTVGKEKLFIMRRAISPFPTLFSKDLCRRHLKTFCLGKGLMLLRKKLSEDIKGKGGKAVTSISVPIMFLALTRSNQTI